MARKSAVSDEKRAAILKEVADGGSVATVAKKHGISTPTLYLWLRSKKNGNKKTKKPASRKRTEDVAPDLTSMMEDLAIARKLKSFLAELGYTKR